jgi:hypothetical protein
MRNFRLFLFIAYVNLVSDWGFIFSLKINLFSPWYSWKIAELALNNNHSLMQHARQQYSPSNRINLNLDFLMLRNASSLKQQSTSRHVAPLKHIILIASQPVFSLSPYCCMLSGEATNTNFIVFCLMTQTGILVRVVTNSIYSIK